MVQMPTTRYSLLARLREPADADAWSEFIDLYQNAIWRFARGSGFQDADAADVVQEVLLLVHQKIGAWQPSGRTGAFRSWLFKTAHCVCMRALRSAGRLDRAVGGSAAINNLRNIPGAGSDSEGRSWREWAFCWAAGLVEREVDATHWKAFVMSGVEGIAPAEIAQTLGISTGAVYLAKCRVLARIRTLVKELAEETT